MGNASSIRGGGHTHGGNGKERHTQPDETQAGVDETYHSQTLWILIFKGHPRDIQSTRVTELYIVFDDDESKNLTIQIQGQYPSPSLKEIWNQAPPRTRPHFLRRLAVSTVPTNSATDMRLRDSIWAAPLNNAESDWTCQSWVGDALTVLQDANLITVEEGDNALNGMVNYISQAPWK